MKFFIAVFNKEVIDPSYKKLMVFLDEKAHTSNNELLKGVVTFFHVSRPPSPFSI